MSSLLPAAPQPTAGVLEAAMRLYRASFARCWGLALLGGALNAVAGAYQTRSLAASLKQPSLGELMGLSPDELVAAVTSRLNLALHSRGLWLSSLAMLLVWLAICAALIACQHATAVGRKLSAGAALGFGLRRLPAALLAFLVSAALITAGLMLLLIPGLWLWGMVQLWLVPLCVEAVGPLEAVRRSWQLVARHWWHTSTAVGIAATVVALLSMLADLMTGVAGQWLGALISVFTLPLLTGVMLSVYYDLKLRRGGGELAVRARPLQRA